MSERRSRRGRRPRGGASKTTTTGVDGDHYDDVDDAASTTTTTERVPSPSPSPSPSSSSSSTTTFREDDVVAVIVDAENFRGKTGFELDHADLLDRLLVWASMRGHAGRTIVVVDHGNEPGAHLLRGGGSIIAGPPPTFASRSRDRE